MPVEIKQITIKAEVGEPGESAGSAGNAPGALPVSVDEIAQLAAEKVMRMLKDQKDR